MKPIYKVIQLTNDIDGIAAIQGTGYTTGTLFNLTSPVVTHPSNLDKTEQQITVIVVADETGHELTITGTDASGGFVAEDVILPDATTVTTLSFFHTVTEILTKVGTLSGDMEVGWTEAGDTTTQPLPINWRQGPANVTLGMEPFPIASITSTSLATMQYSLDDPEDTVNFPSYSNDAAWRSPDTLVAAPPDPAGLTVSTDTRLEGPTRAIRGVIQGGAGITNTQWRFTIIQGENI
ncbi:MAG: hypothetical protein V3V84_08380 [Candidatus Bathyarchaeia archaeon]